MVTSAAWTWRMVEPAAPLQRQPLDVPRPGPGEAVVEVAGCGICHTDIGFLHDGVPTRSALPLTLGHEIAGRIAALADDARLDSGAALEAGAAVVVPAVLPCGDCPLCRSGRDNVCLGQKMPGNDLDGGFATHIRVPARFLVPVGDLPSGHRLAHLAVVADAVTTPYQALSRARVQPDDRVIIIGTGGIGIYGVQIAAALGARVVAVDRVAARVQRAREFGAALAVCTEGLDARDARDAVREAAREDGWERFGWKIFEMSGSIGGQTLAFSLLGPAATLAVVGFSPRALELRLSNLMAFDADAFGSWGCRPVHYPAVLDLIRAGRVQVKPFVSFHPLEQVNELLERVRAGDLDTRAVLLPEAGAETAAGRPARQGGHDT